MMMDADKSRRSVFVGNIPYEATEEKLKDIFSEVGAVVSFKLVYDRETGKPKGYGFCEYKDQETALSAMRNLNNFEIAGRSLRVDNACTEKSRMEMQNLMAEPVAESPYGAPCEPSRAPETISKAVASLPPEQMFQLMQQMKLCIQNNPQEARTMLIQNPQLAYALLQAQVVMKIVDPETAVSMLHKSPPAVPPVGVPQPVPGVGAHPHGVLQPERPAGMIGSAGPGRVPPMDYGGRGLRPGPGLGPGMGPEPGLVPKVEPRQSSMEPIRPVFGEEHRGARDPRSRDPRDRGGSQGPLGGGPGPGGMQGRPGMGPGGGGGGGQGLGVRPQLPPHLAGADPEKAQLIMQVLQLTDEQIACLPPEQRQSIMVLKEQINQAPR